MTLVVGLTGGICSGKSTVANILTEMGIPVLDADRVVHQVYRPGTHVYEKLVARFGKEIVDGNGEIDRKKLGAIVFSDPEARAFLENATHPLVEGRMREFVARCRDSKRPLCVIEAALIFEKKKGKLFDKIVTVYCDRETQISRLVKRDGISREEAEKKINSQMPLDEKAKLADHVIDNSGSLEETRRQVEELVALLSQEGNSPGGGGD